MLDRFKTTKPVWCVTFAFVLTIAFARWVSYSDPRFHYNILGVHVHHYMYGIFMITLAGYCALALKGPRATFWIALLYGCGAGFTFDELGMWLNSSISPRLRWDRDGLAIGVFALVIAGLFSIGIKKKSALPEIEPTTFSGSSEQQSNTSDVSTSDAMAVSLED